MICKKCGFEYVDGLKECPNCQEPNVPIETTVLSDAERDTFNGVTIEETSKGQSGDDFKVYAPGETPNDDGPEEQSYQGIHVKTFTGSSFIWQIIFILLVLGFIFFALPLMIAVTVICGLAYYLYRWLFN